MDLAYRIDLWDNAGARIEQTLASVDNLSMAVVAYQQAKKAYPGRNITLRNGARVIESTWQI